MDAHYSNSNYYTYPTTHAPPSDPTTYGNEQQQHRVQYPPDASYYPPYASQSLESYSPETHHIFVPAQQQPGLVYKGDYQPNSSSTNDTQVASSHHPGDGVAPLTEVRNAYNPHPLAGNPYLSLLSTSSRVHGHDDPLVKRNRSSSTTSTKSNPYPTRRPSAVSTTPAPTPTVPLSRPTRRLIYNDLQCVMRNNNGLPIGPSNHVIVPQLPFIESAKGDVGVRQKSIPFQLAGFPELGVRVSKVLKAKESLDLIGGDDMVFDCIGREYSMIKFRIVWPGYQPFEKRLKTRELAASRGVVLSLVCRAIDEFIKDVERYQTRVEPGFEDWEVGRRPLITRTELLVTGLIHRGCANWQPEIWCPSYRGD
ncbi:hypothetical protein PQX77_005171 [Marasmius sp. AFHP31]|nr:hypothetical protein PQX77_005171 [Marasmius sp. AFHP31]